MNDIDEVKKALLYAVKGYPYPDEVDGALERLAGLQARVAELEVLVSRLEDAMTPEQLADFNRPVMSRSPT